MKRFTKTLIRLFFYNRIKRYRITRPPRVKPELNFSNGEDWYEFGI